MAVQLGSVPTQPSGQTQPPIGPARVTAGPAIVLSGGGAKGDFKVGALRGLYNRGERPKIRYGASVGSVNAPNCCVSCTVITQTRGKLEFPFTDLGEQMLKNIARPIQAQPEATAEPFPPLPDKLSIAVLPFQNMSGDPGQEYFADGMAEEIITARPEEERR